MKPMNINYYNYLPARQTGLSLVELMISLAIGLLLLLGISTLVVQQNTSRTEMEKSSRQIENGRYAMQLLHNDIQMAGFYGEYSPPASTVTNPFTMTMPDPCVTVGTLGWNNTQANRSVPVPIFGYPGAGVDPTGCLDNYQPNTAVLVLRRVSANSIAAASAVAGTTFLQVSKCSAETTLTPFVLGTVGFTLRQGNCMGAAPTLANLWPYIVRIYYVSSCSMCGSDTIPTLKMLEFVGGTQSLVALVEGIENMQFEYGIDNVSGLPPPGCAVGDRDGVPDIYTSAPNAAQWQDVMTARVHLLARNDATTAGHTDDKSYNLGPAASAVSPGGSFKRHVYSQLVRAVNSSGRREICF